MGNIKKYYLYSAGGCGTRTFHKFLHKHIKKINNQIDVHHGKCPDHSKNIKCIYLYGNPANCILSFYNKEKRQKSSFIGPHCTNLKIKKVKIGLKEYIKNQEDLFRLEHHFDKYITNKTDSKEIIMVRYEDMWDNLPYLFELLHLDKKLIQKFPEKHERSSVNLIDKDEFKKLESIYSNLIEKQNKYKPIDILTVK